MPHPTTKAVTAAFNAHPAALPQAAAVLGGDPT